MKRAVQLDPGHAHAWVGIGNAYHRMRKPEQALEAFEKAVQADPNDGYTRRNLGGILIGFKRIDEAVQHLRRALDLMPDDPQAIFGLATALEQLGTREADEEADQLYRRFIQEHPNSPMVEQAEKARTAFAHRQVKSNSVGGFRPDVMMYIAGALDSFKKQGAQKRQAIALEIAILGRGGLDIGVGLVGALDELGELALLTGGGLHQHLVVGLVGEDKDVGSAAEADAALVGAGGAGAAAEVGAEVDVDGLLGLLLRLGVVAVESVVGVGGVAARAG